jgi:hypothetical protein
MKMRRISPAFSPNTACQSRARIVPFRSRAADGDLSKTYVVPSDAEIVPPPYMAELARIYGLD